MAALAGSTGVDAPGQTGYFSNWATSSYAANSQIFFQVDTTVTDGGPGGRPATPGNAALGPVYDGGGDRLGYGFYVALDGGATISKSFPDGTSNTIVFAEKYAQCNNSLFAAPNFTGGNYWSYCSIDGLSQVPGYTTDLSQSGGYDSATNTGYLPSTVPVYPFFAWTIFDAPPSPLAANLISIGPGSKPQFQPQPYTGPVSQCDPRLTQTAHAAIQVSMGDGSVRGVSTGVSGATWWAAVTPSGGETLGPDW